MTDIGTGTQVDTHRLELLRRRLHERGLSSAAESIADVDEMNDSALSEGQLRMWFVHAADPSGALLNVCLSYHITGDVDLARLRAAANAVTRRHSVLRTTYRTEVNASGEDTGLPVLTVHPDLQPGWTEHDLSELSERARQLRLEVLAQREFAAPFDLGNDSPLRITVNRTGPAEFVMLLVAHHIAWDDGSWEVFFADLTRAYNGSQLEPARRAAVAAGSCDADSREAEVDIEYWRAVMVDPPEPLELPGPMGSAVPTSWRSQQVSTRLPGDTAERVIAMADGAGTTPYAVLLAVFGVLMHRYSHVDDFLVATPVLNRSGDTEDVIGYFGNTVAMRLKPRAGTTFREFLAQTGATAVGAFAHQRIGLDRMVRELNPDRRHGAERMTRVGFGFRGPDRFGFTPPGVTCERGKLRAHLTHLPLGFMIEFDSSEVLVELEYLVEIIDPKLAEQLIDHFVVLLHSALDHPDTVLSRLELMGPDDSAWLRQVAYGEEFHTPPATLTDLVQAQVARTPDAIAVVYEGRHRTYREINDEANRVAHWLIGQGVGAQDRVAILLDKSPELVTTALGVIKAGAVYVPIDPTYPQDRLDFILGDCDAKVVVREPVTNLGEYRCDDPTDADRVRPLKPGNTAYLIYTSGSTGQPKGVPVPHRPVAEYFVWFKDDYRVDVNDRLLQVASPSFDVSIAEIFGTLSCGARLVIHRPDGLRDIGYLTDLLRNEGITAMHFVPSLLGLFLSLPGVNQWRTLQRVPIGGEALPGEVADKFRATFDALLHNFYGPTETVINASRFKIEGRQGTRIVPIGKPKINTQLHLLDDALQPVPVGSIGEIYIGGTHVADGYHRRPALTAQRFVADPFTPGSRLYRSGDLARRNSDGDVEFVGRADEQVKIRGFRIELGDVAAAISVDPSVGQAVVVVSELPDIGKSLVGYLTPADGEIVDVDRVRARVAAALPEYMTPTGYVVVDEIPITAHGKIDRAALPELSVSAVTEYRDPATDTEHQLAQLFADLLGHGAVGADDSFFELGGHSLLATRLVAELRSRCGVDVGVRDIFELGTVSRLAAHIDALAAGQAVSTRPKLLATSQDGPVPLSPSQLRSWFGYRIEGPTPINNIPFAARLSGPCDVAALVAAIGDVVDRHAILRTTYREIDGTAYQIVHPPAEIMVRRARGGSEEWLQAELAGERRHSFDLERDWPIRAAVLGIGDEHVLSLVIHHIAGDHWSGGVLFTDLVTAYRARRAGQRPGWAPLPVQYTDYVVWQKSLLADDAGVVGPQREYWRRQLDSAPVESGLPLDFARPRLPTGAGNAVELSIDNETRGRLAALCRDIGVTEFMLLQAAVAVVLCKAGGGPDILLGTPVAGRSESELEQLAGFFVNFVVLRNDLRGNPTLRDVLLRAREMALAAYSNQDLPFEQVVDELNPPRSLSRNPLFQVVVHVREELPQRQVIDADTEFTVVEPTFDIAQADLSFNFLAGNASDGTGYRGYLIYRPELYSQGTVDRLAGWLNRVVTAFAEHPDRELREVEILGTGEKRRILGEWSTAGGPAQVYVLDDDLAPAPIGVPGDLYLAGGPISAAKWYRSDEAATRLVPDPFQRDTGAQLYRTGERARWGEDGRLEIIGGEAGVGAVSVATAEWEAPQTDTERALAELLTDLLGVEDVGRHDDFFALGGDSVLAVQLAARAREAGLPLTARMVFEHNAVAELATVLDCATGRGSAEQPEDTHYEPMSASGLSEDELAALTAQWSTSGDAL
ncbi:non-ribosomal peptide synthetase [Mycolicibacterium cyprinidarum]|uniref:Non-ribosomal peptide synthetase n=1 Tax=Mycolicibacterium cyprinidarum TaxID=2860311 RepID=A0ABQ4VAA6_9MYCO|nr:non-ribosomal peptide synthetase [Mycolicibacterium sp. NGTWS0302]GJF15529.1 non-ribosomal peptide synthetase [Mycolicibacterium sp. NGTWSNA01]